jgi:hypothetical protein
MIIKEWMKPFVGIICGTAFGFFLVTAMMLGIKWGHILHNWLGL